MLVIVSGGYFDFAMLSGEGLACEDGSGLSVCWVVCM